MIHFLYCKIVTYLDLYALHGYAHMSRGRRVMAHHFNGRVGVSMAIPMTYGCSRLSKTYKKMMRPRGMMDEKEAAWH